MGLDIKKNQKVTCKRVPRGFSCTSGNDDLGKFNRVMWRSRKAAMWQDATVHSPQFRMGSEFTIKSAGIDGRCSTRDDGKTLACIEPLWD